MLTKKRGNLNCCMNCPLQAQKDQRQSCRCTPWKMWGQDTRNGTRATTSLIQVTIVTIRRKDLKNVAFKTAWILCFPDHTYSYECWTNALYHFAMGHDIMRDSLSEIIEILEMITIWHHKPPRARKAVHCSKRITSSIHVIPVPASLVKAGGNWTFDRP